MPRRRLGVVLLVPEPQATEIQGLRRGLGDPALERVAPHITLVPPVNVRADDVPVALAILRAAGAGQRTALTLDLGPAASFVPASETAYLAVGGQGTALGALASLRDAVFRGPLERSLDHPFVPHCTIADGIARERIAAGVDALADYQVTVAFDRLHLLEEQRLEGHRRWVPIADMPFTVPAIVGRGGIELELTATSLVDPEGLAVIEAARDRDPADQDDDEVLGEVPGEVLDEVLGEVDGAGVPAGAAPVVVTARRSARVVGVALGWSHPQLQGEVTIVVVAPEHHGQGIGRQLHAALESALS